MGSGRFDSDDTVRAYTSYTTANASKSTDEIYTSRTMENKLNPLGVKIRESRDSIDNPKSTPLIVALDVTGSMGLLADTIARDGLGTLFNGIFDRKPISDPHIMFMGIGDANCDQAPLQVSQFEADKRIIEQLNLLWLEHGGGGNSFESYNLPWYFAAFHTAHDSMEKRGKRGYLFTIGDELAPGDLTKDQIKRFIGDDMQGAPTTKDLLELAQRSYDCYHIVIEQGNYASSNLKGVMDSWTKLMGQHVIPLADHKKLAETIVSAIEVAEGRDAGESAALWGSGADVVHRAIRHIPRGTGPGLIEGPR